MGKYVIDGETFSTIQRAKSHIRNILKNIGICKSVKTKNEPVFKRLAKFLARHHDAVRKGVIDAQGNNIVQDIEIKHNLKGDLQLRFTKEDGFTTEDISWVRCINPAEKTHWQKLSSAMRTAIQEQIQQFKKNNPEPKCLADPCKNHDDDIDYTFHVDHKIPFKKLQLDYLKTMPAEDIKDFDDCPETNKKKFTKKDQKWENQWKEFHKKHAELRWLCWPCNLQRKKLLQEDA